MGCGGISDGGKRCYWTVLNFRTRNYWARLGLGLGLGLGGGGFFCARFLWVGYFVGGRRFESEELYLFCIGIMQIVFKFRYGRIAAADEISPCVITHL